MSFRSLSCLPRVNIRNSWHGTAMTSTTVRTGSTCSSLTSTAASLNCVNSDGPLWSVQCRLDVEPGIGGDEVWIDPEGWDELYAYIWVAYYTNYEWPGIKLKKNKLGYYVFKLNLLKGYPYDGYVEFNDNNGNTTWSFYSYEIDDHYQG